LVFPCFMLYDWMQWHTDSYAPSIPLIISRAIGSGLTFSIALALSIGVSNEKLRLSTLLLVFIPASFGWCCIFFAPQRSLDYAMCLVLFQIWSGYCTLSLPTKEIAVLQFLLTAAQFLGGVYATDNIDINRVIRPNFVDDPSQTPSWTEYAMALGFFILGHFLGIKYNRSTRYDLQRHAKQLVWGEKSLAHSKRSLAECQQLLEEVFPPNVFARLREKSGGGNALTACEQFDECTFLFAKIVGLDCLTKEQTAVGPHIVVEILQNVFDRFDTLADTFKVQKVRKTVYESYMLAAGLPDRAMVEGEERRAVAIVSLAVAMVHVMDTVNHELAKSLEAEGHAGTRLDVQIGIHSGSAIAGIIGHKRYQYDLCGDDVNVAARMCSASSPGCINVTAKTYALLADDFKGYDRGERPVKGKGLMRQYWIIGGRHSRAAKQLIMADEVIRKFRSTTGPSASAPTLNLDTLPPIPPSPSFTFPSEEGGKDTTVAQS